MAYCTTFYIIKNNIELDDHLYCEYFTFLDFRLNGLLGRPKSKIFFLPKMTDFYNPQYEDTEIHDELPETQVQVLSYETYDTKEDRIVFDLINAPPAYANALRRTLLADVPSMAFDLVGIDQNTGMVPDEVLCHRIGLIPLNIDPSYFTFPPETPNPNTDDDPNMVVMFGLNIIGGEGPEPNYDGVDSTWEGQLPPVYTGPSGKVMSSHFVWMPFQGQVESFGDNPPCVLHDDVEVTTLVPGQRIHLYARAYKGTGSIHAKFSPVCTAYYRELPKVEINQDMADNRKQLLKESCPCDVFEIEETGDIYTANIRNCTMCRECTRLPELKANVRLGNVANHYEFTVESLGVRSSIQLVKEALQILREKCKDMQQAVDDAIPK
ncbi:RNA polymerase Rpb3/Rpb11 dimerization domain containing protein [Tritrichomonas foetus]|uniref:RNA polymerase Rpb3/Rpb11 dimerization domain containing protein n=1 Tax=Tritrichomonas foetus TaxID=1144522 RepID=A0A1J4L1F0_9EUKA|nr:RNA polymerase Rpb3/Rpb11 dimerization domain containing protein [Tritrichomonas foetus]|eukprot:OHT17242.1 RNA polymerase Rpb3/Rpb11 dimerization domain containing protein [Tritrichomonas foetus]